MNEVLGIIDSLEASILEGKKIPLTNHIILNEREILILIDKLKLVLQSNSNLIRESIDQGLDNSVSKEDQQPQMQNIFETSDNQKSEEIIRAAQLKGLKIINESRNYAEYILANIQLMVTKTQKNLITMEKGLEEGRKQLKNLIKGENKEGQSQEEAQEEKICEKIEQ
jgi:hypothetical protein